MSILIVGSGVFGASTALTLARNGHKNVTVLDRSADGLAAPDSASNDLNKIIRADYSDDSYCSLGKEAISEWRTDPLIAAYYHEVGVVFHSGEQRQGAAEYCSRGVANGSRQKDAALEKTREGQSLPPPAHVFDSDVDASHAFPQEMRKELGEGIRGFGRDGQQIGYVNPRGGWAEANNAVRAYMQEAQRLGVNVVGNASVTSLILEGRRCKGVRTADGRSFHADHVVLAPGSWLRLLLSRVLPSSSSRIPAASPSAQCVITLQLTPEEARTYARAPVVLNFDTGLYSFEPTKDGLMKVAIHAATGYVHPSPCLESSDRYPSFDDSTPTAEGDSVAKPGAEHCIPADKVDQMLVELATVYPAIAKKEKLAFTRVCWYSDTRDENWIIDRHPDVDNLLIAGGDSGHGYKFLPTIGRLVMARLGMSGVPELTEHQRRVFSFEHHAKLAQDEQEGRPVVSSDSGRSPAKTVNPRARL